MAPTKVLSSEAREGATKELLVEDDPHVFLEVTRGALSRIEPCVLAVLLSRRAGTNGRSIRRTILECTETSEAPFSPAEVIRVVKTENSISSVSVPLR